jgi:hypothetical protein
MNYDLYLLWTPNGGWEVFNSVTCPATSNFPHYMYRKYNIPEEQHEIAFEKLMSVKQKLDSENTMQTRNNEREIYPDISILLLE